MGKSVRDVMTPDPVTMKASQTLVDAARAMRDGKIGALIVEREGASRYGIVTDRDLVVRGLADGPDGAQKTLEAVCSSDALQTVSPDEEANRAVTIMRDAGVRRIPVMDGDRLVGIVSLGDLAVDRDRESVLGHISAAPPTG